MKTHSTSADAGATATAALQRWANGQLSPWARARHLALLLVASAATVVLLSLWTTEPGLPARTHLAFAVMTAIGLAWTLFAAWVLARRRVLYARQRVIAAWMSVTFTTLLAAASALAAAVTRTPAALSAMLMGFFLLAVAIVLLRRARARHDELRIKQSELQRKLESSSA